MINIKQNTVARILRKYKWQLEKKNAFKHTEVRILENIYRDSYVYMERVNLPEQKCAASSADIQTDAQLYEYMGDSNLQQTYTSQKKSTKQEQQLPAVNAH